MRLAAKIVGDERGKQVVKTANDRITISLYVQDGSDKENFVGEVELYYKDDVLEFGGPDSTEEFKPDMNEWVINYRPRIDEYTDPTMMNQGHVYPVMTNRKR